MDTDAGTFSYSSAGELIDLERYPIDDLTSERAQALIAECQRQLSDSGASAMPAFVKPEAAAALAAEIKPIRPRAFHNSQEHNVYFKPDDPSLPADHPARHQMHTSQRTIAYDLLTDEMGIRHLYNWSPVREFIAAVLGRGRLYLQADPLAALNVQFAEAGDELGWHYDRADFVTTLLLQTTEEGGVFEYVPHLRSSDDENYDGLSQLFAGTHPDLVSRSGQAGALTLFVGRYSPHRVSPVQGETPRMVAVLSYESEPDVVFSQAARKRFYGRAG